MPAGPSETESLIEHEIRVAASPETVFAYFTDPAKMVQWMGTEATLDPRPGGVCRINPSGQEVMLGEFLEVDPRIASSSPGAGSGRCSPRPRSPRSSRSR